MPSTKRCNILAESPTGKPVPYPVSSYGIVVKVHQDKRVVKKTVYVALGVTTEGHKELLGLWLAETEGSKFWLSVLTELQNRGVEDIFIACS